MKIKDNICQSCGKTTKEGRIINEDRRTIFQVEKEGKQYQFIIVLDGASGLGKNNQIIEGYTSAEWYVKFIEKELKQTLQKKPEIALEVATKKAIESAMKVVERFERENGITLIEYEKPSASLSIARSDKETTELYLLGDTETIIGYQDGTVEKVENENQKALQKNDNNVIIRMVEIARAKKCDVVDTRNEYEIQRILQSNRGKKNKGVEGSYWTTSMSPEAVEHGVHKQVNNHEIRGILLASDGFDYSLLGMDEKRVFDAVEKYGADSVVKKIREVEEQDPKCNKYPRLKKGDDLTIISADYRE